MKNLILIAACDKKGLIGSGNKLPWNIRSEMEYFLNRVAFKPLVMGKNTCLSLKKPINSARNYVLTSDTSFHREGFITVNSMDQLLNEVNEVELYVVGGASIYNQFLDLALGDERIRFIVELSFIMGEYKGDSYFPLDKLEVLHSTTLHKHFEGGELKWYSEAYYRKTV